MPRVAVQDNSRVSLRIRPEDKALLVRAVSYTHTDLTAFVLQNAVQAAKAVIAEAGEQVASSERDSLPRIECLGRPTSSECEAVRCGRVRCRSCHTCTSPAAGRAECDHSALA